MYSWDDLVAFIQTELSVEGLQRNDRQWLALANECLDTIARQTRCYKRIWSGGQLAAEEVITQCETLWSKPTGYAGSVERTPYPEAVEGSYAAKVVIPSNHSGLCAYTRITARNLGNVKSLRLWLKCSSSTDKLQVGFSTQAETGYQFANITQLQPYTEWAHYEVDLTTQQRAIGNAAYLGIATSGQPGSELTVHIDNVRAVLDYPSDRVIRLPSDLIETIAVRYRGNPLAPRTVRALDVEVPGWRTDDQGEPVYYALSGMSMSLWRDPGTFDDLELEGYALLPHFPARSPAETNPLVYIPSSFHLLPAYYVLLYLPVNPQSQASASRVERNRTRVEGLMAQCIEQMRNVHAAIFEPF